IVSNTDDNDAVQGVFTSFRARTPWLELDIDRTKAKTIGVSMDDVFEALQVYMGSYYVNDFNRFGRTWQVNVQADTAFRSDIRDLAQIKLRNSRYEIVPLGTLADVNPSDGPVMIT